MVTWALPWYAMVQITGTIDHIAGGGARYPSPKTQMSAFEYSLLILHKSSPHLKLCSNITVTRGFNSIFSHHTEKQQRSLAHTFSPKRVQDEHLCLD